MSIDGADHLLSDARDARWTAGVIAAWADRVLPEPGERSAPEVERGAVLVRETGESAYAQEIVAGPHHLHADEPVSLGGSDTGPGPYEII